MGVIWGRVDDIDGVQKMSLVFTKNKRGHNARKNGNTLTECQVKPKATCA